MSSDQEDENEDNYEEIDEMLEISVESLVGTVFEMRLSSSETVASIKGRLQRLEGIPRQQMHLLFRGEELPDPLSLRECQVASGSTLKLVLQLRGGPINTRRVPLPQSQQASPNSKKQLPSHLREEIMNNVPKHGQVTVVLFRDGDRVNMYQVLENRGDGTLTPLSHKSSSSSNKELDPDLESRLRENAVTMNKMSDLRKQLQSLSMAKKEKKSRRKRKSNRNRKNSDSKNNEDNELERKKLSDIQIVRGRDLRRQLSTITLPPIGKNGNNTDDELSSTTTSIFPLNSSTATFIGNDGVRRDSFNTSLGKLDRVPEWLDSNKANMRHSNNNVNRHKGKSKKSRKQHLDKSNNNNIDKVNNDNDADDEAQVLTINNDNLNNSGGSKMISTDIVALTRDMTGKPVQVHRRNTRSRHRRRGQHGRSKDLEDTSVTRMSTSTTLAGRRSSSNMSSGLSLSGSLKSTHNNALEISESAKTRVDLVDDLKTSPVPNTNWKEEEVEEIFYGKPEEVEIESGRVFGRNEQEEQGRRSIFRQKEQEEADEEGRISSEVPRTSPESIDNNARVRSAKSAKLTGPKSAGRPSFSTGRPGSSSSKNGKMRRKKTPKKRCAHVECNKRINITNGFTCRCQRVFCAKHRHPESHDCDFDYKTEGRKILERANPPLALPKLPKI